MFLKLNTVVLQPEHHPHGYYGMMKKMIKNTVFFTHWYRGHAVKDDILLNSVITLWNLGVCIIHIYKFYKCEMKTRSHEII
jgi:hypothetical protein